MDKNKGIPVTYAQARGRLNITPDKQVHSFWNGFCLSGADLELSRVDEMLKTAADSNMLFLSEEMGGALHHDIAAWDHKYQKWTYLECEPEKAAQLKQAL